MFLCIPKEKVVEFNQVQKNIDINALFDEVKLIKKVEDIKEDYVPVNFLTTIRTAYTNKLVTRVVEDCEINYISVSDKIPEDVSVFNGEDLIAYITSLGVSLAYDPTIPEIQKIMVNAKFLPIGIYYSAFYPYVFFYSQVIIHDDFIKEMEELLNKQLFKIIDIKDKKTKGNIRKINEEIIAIGKNNKERNRK